VAAGISEGDRPHAPETIRRAAEQAHPAPGQLGAHRVHVGDDDGELPGTLPRLGQDLVEADSK
jgi:hypothetical protein